MDQFDQSKKPADGIRRRAISDITPKAYSGEVSRPSVPSPREDKIISPAPEAGADRGILIVDLEEDKTFPEAEDLAGIKGARRFTPLVQFGAGAAMVLLLLGGILVSTVFSRVTLFIKPRVENIAFRDLAILLDTSVSKPLVAQKVIPAERIEFTKKAAVDFESTGREFVEEKARGKAKIYNRFSSSPQVLAATTRFWSDAGILFRLPKSVTIPGAKIEEGQILPQFIETELIADKSGEEANISGETALSIPGFKGTPKHDGFYAVAPSGFSGGFKGEARVVSKDDLKSAEENITKRVYDELKQEIARKIPSEFKLVESLREIQITKLNSPPVSAKLDRFTVEAETRGKVLIFKEQDITGLLRELVFRSDGTKQFVPGSADLTYQVRSIDFGKGRAEATVRGNFKAKTVIPQEELAGIVRGKKEGSIMEALKKRNEIASFRISFFPPWRSKAPNDTAKIRLVIEE